METHMTRTEFNENLKKLLELTTEADKIATKMLDVVEIDGQFIKTGPMYSRIDGEVIPKVERRNVTIAWGEIRDIKSALQRMYDFAKDEVDGLAKVSFDKNGQIHVDTSWSAYKKKE